MKRLVLCAVLSLTAAAAAAQTSAPCATGQDLPRIPELVSKDGKLRGTVVVLAEQQNIGTRVPNTAPTPTAIDQCYPQTVRAMKGLNTDQPYPPVPASGVADPMPGPTLRARVGELVELTFLNQIDMNRFPKSLDKGQCDAVSGFYPTNTQQPPNNIPGTDEYPNCFHGSVTANVHFHGTHVNPNSTGDNVFVEVRPSLRTHETNSKPIVTSESVKQDFDTFFKRCEMELPASNPTKEWPKTWADFPKHYTETQKTLLKRYDSEILGTSAKSQWLWPTDAKQIALRQWPQYYVGAFPYCYRIPMLTSVTNPESNDIHAIHAHGKGMAEENKEDSKPLIMGQAPGTHWYHAHKHGSTTIDVSNGMVGAFIIEGRYDEDLNAFYGAGWTRKAKVMVLNQLGGTPNLERGGGPPLTGQDKGATLSVNGRYAPVVHMRPGEVQMWRIVNASSRTGVYFPNFPTGFQWRQLAQDGVQFADVNYQKTGTAASPSQTLLLAGGNRADLLVMAPASAPAAGVPLQIQYEVDPQDLPGAALNTLLTIKVDGEPVTGNQAQFIPAAPQFPSFLSDISPKEIKGTKRIVFASQPPALGPQHTIDGIQFSGEVGAVVLLNQAEEWTVLNATYGPPISHPFHIHLNPFQITEVFDPNAELPNTAGAGTVAFSQNTVTGAGTNFTDDAHAGDWIWIAGRRYEITNVASATSLTVSPAARAAVPSGASYRIATPRYVVKGVKPRLATQCVFDPADARPCRADGAVEQSNLIWWDVFPIPSGRTFTDASGNSVNVPGYFKMRSRFVDYSGYYVIHCHILAHEDRGMMTVVEVAPLQSPYSHH